MKFTLGNIQFETNEKGNRFYKVEDGKKTRISEDKFNEAFEETKYLTFEDDLTEQAQQKADELTPAVLNEHGCVDCRNCTLECKHRECMRRNPTDIGGLGLCPRLDVKLKVEEEPKKKKRRMPKDIAYIDGEFTLTAKQVDFIKHIPDSDFYDGLGCSIWCDILADEIKGQFANKPMTVGAMISTLREKGLISVAIERVNEHKAKYFEFTEFGRDIATRLGLE